jgi:hypothetical protein
VTQAQQLPQPPAEGVKKSESVKAVEAGSKLIEERIDKQLLERLDELSSRISAIEQRLEKSSSEVERLEKSGEEEELIPSPKLLGGSMDIDRVMKLLERSDNPLRDVMSYVIIMEALQNLRMNNMLMQERLAEMLERRRKREEADSRGSLEQQFERLLKLIESRTGTQLSAQDIITLYKEMWSTLKEIKSAVPAVDEEKLVSRIVSEVEKKVPQAPQGASIKDVMGIVKDVLSSVKELTSTVKELSPVQQQQLQTTTTATPLVYQGSAPWWWHPDARVAWKDLVETIRGIGETVKDIILAFKAPETQIVKASKPLQAAQTSLPGELSLG